MTNPSAQQALQQIPACLAYSPPAPALPTTSVQSRIILSSLMGDTANQSVDNNEPKMNTAV
jgi:hypothetical protein